MQLGVTAAVRLGGVVLAALFLAIAAAAYGSGQADTTVSSSAGLAGMAVTALFAGFLARVAGPCGRRRRRERIVGGDVRGSSPSAAREVRELCQVLNQTNARLVRC
jgi:hypothetical protein